MTWKAGLSRAVITPETAGWLAGYGVKRPPKGKVHDLWVKTLALEGGYEGGPYVYEYGHAAERWASGTESRIVDSVTELVGQIRQTARR